EDVARGVEGVATQRYGESHRERMTRTEEVKRHRVRHLFSRPRDHPDEFDEHVILHHLSRASQREKLEAGLDEVTGRPGEQVKEEPALNRADPDRSSISVGAESLERVLEAVLDSLHRVLP